MTHPPDPGLQLNRALIEALRYEWFQSNKELFGLAMRVPVIVLHDGANLGTFDPRTRQLSIQRELAYRGRWGQVVEVLRHEMAHQFVHEIQQIHDEAPHGPAFRKVCAQRGIDARAAGLPEGGDGDLDRLLRKVRRLVALSESDNPHEAQAAARRARQLLAEHDLTLTPDDARYTFRQLGPAKQRFAIWEKAILTILEDHFGVRALYNAAFLPDRGKWGWVLEIVGTVEHVEVAAYVHDALLHHADHAWRAHKKAQGLKGNKHRRNFLYGLMRGFLEALEASSADDPGEALIHLNDPALNAHFRLRHPRLVSGSPGTFRKNEALEAGLQAGANLTIRPGVQGGTGQPRLLQG